VSADWTACQWQAALSALWCWAVQRSVTYASLFADLCLLLQPNHPPYHPRLHAVYSHSLTRQQFSVHGAVVAVAVTFNADRLLPPVEYVTQTADRQLPLVRRPARVTTVLTSSRAVASRASDSVSTLNMWHEFLPRDAMLSAVMPQYVVRLSVTFRNRDHIISLPNSLRYLLTLTPSIGYLVQREHSPKLRWNTITCNISETVQDMSKVTMAD